MKTIIRVEYIDGRGMFRNAIWREVRECTYIFTNHENFNTPYQDNLDLDLHDAEWFCAYKSIYQLNEWVGEEDLQWLIEMGFKIYQLKVEEYQEGDHQVIFTKSGIISKEDITDIFTN